MRRRIRAGSSHLLELIDRDDEFDQRRDEFVPVERFGDLCLALCGCDPGEL